MNFLTSRFVSAYRAILPSLTTPGCFYRFNFFCRDVFRGA